MLLIWCTGISCWVVYGLLLNAVPIILWNVSTLLLAIAILAMKLKFIRQAYESIKITIEQKFQIKYKQTQVLKSRNVSSLVLIKIFLLLSYNLKINLIFSMKNQNFSKNLKNLTKLTKDYIRDLAGSFRFFLIFNFSVKLPKKIFKIFKKQFIIILISQPLKVSSPNSQ